MIEAIASILLTIGLVMIIEGLAYVLAPSLIEPVLRQLSFMQRQHMSVSGALDAIVTCLCALLRVVFDNIEEGFDAKRTVFPFGNRDSC